jgi:hypothetical protein
MCLCVSVCVVCGLASVSLALPPPSCRVLPDTAELNQPLHEYTRMESCAQLTGEIGAGLVLLPPPRLSHTPPPLRPDSHPSRLAGTRKAQFSSAGARKETRQWEAAVGGKGHMPEALPCSSMALVGRETQPQCPGRILKSLRGGSQYSR